VSNAFPNFTWSHLVNQTLNLFGVLFK
jgi:hypothetical protein